MTLRDVTQKFACQRFARKQAWLLNTNAGNISQISSAKKLQSQPDMDDLTDVSSGAEVVEDVAEMRPESPESEHERVEVPVVNPTGKPAVSSKRKAPQTKLHSICSKRA